ncbi:cytochrome P450 2D26-like [Branchiostoma lanceolatum]|uniref:cytochrome P450 2D26-like n=1 Tax=Branchiostoma lanceolatum TaxID=7740 RepID=UPI0034524882
MFTLMEAVAAVRLYVDLPTILVAMSTCLLTYMYLQRHKNLPPGPPTLPILGNIPYMAWIYWKGSTFPPDTLYQLSQKYGDVMTMWVAREPYVIISGYETIREVLVRRAEDFSSRKVPPAIVDTRGDGTSSKAAKGVLFAEYGHDWRQQRRFALKTLRDFGVGKRSLEGKICEEAAALSQELVAKDGQPFNIKHLMQNAVSNIICSIVFGKRFEYGDPEFLWLIEVLNDNVNVKPSEDLLANIHPALRHLPFGSPEQRKLAKSTSKLQTYCRGQIETHRETFDPNDIRDFIDAFLLEQQHAGGEHAQSSFTDKQLQEIIMDLFLAGTETTATTMCWAVLYMLLYPDVQEKASCLFDNAQGANPIRNICTLTCYLRVVHQEIDSVLGQAVPSYALRDKMPYTTATLAEVQRINSAVPIGVPHSPSRTTTLNGYTIPADVSIISNIWSVHMNPQLFPEPRNFNPDRFLDQDGNFVKHEALIPFSVGPRVCLGELLAKMELFLLYVSLMQRFTFHLPEGAPAPSPEGNMTALINMPHPYDLCALSRG